MRYLLILDLKILVKSTLCRVISSTCRAGEWLNPSMATDIDLNFKYYHCNFIPRVMKFSYISTPNEFE